MTIILTILKWIGILLLIVLGIVLALVLLVLLVPIVYRLEGEVRGKPEIFGKVTWFFKLLSVNLSYQEGFSFSVKAAGIQLLPKKKEKDADQKQEGETSSATGEPAELKPSGSETGDSESKVSDAADSETTGTKTADAVSGSSESDKSGKTKGTEPEPSQDALEEKMYRFSDRAEAICKKIAHYLEILRSDAAQIVLHNALVQAMKIIKHVLPRKMDVYLEIGTGDPASTGEILALQGIFYPVLQDKVRIVPDFEEKRVEGEFYISGRITLGVLLVCAVRIILKKEVLYLIKRLRKKEEA